MSLCRTTRTSARNAQRAGSFFTAGARAQDVALPRIFRMKLREDTLRQIASPQKSCANKEN
jgi:hypothetical protein